MALRGVLRKGGNTHGEGGLICSICNKGGKTADSIKEENGGAALRKKKSRRP